MSLIELPRERTSIDKIENTLLKVPVKIEKKQISSGKTLKEDISDSTSRVNKHLGKYKNKYDILTKDNEITAYFRELDRLGVGAIDTETTSTDSNTCDIVGIPLYGPGLRPVYIPLAHISYTTGQIIPNQANKQLVIDLLSKSMVQWVLHNGKFDYKVLKRTMGVSLNIYWDTYTAMRVLNENEESNELKELHIKYCNSQDSSGWSYGRLFGNLPSNVIPIDVFTLYAAGDGPKTFELYEFQKEQFKQERLKKLYWVFKEIEMPIIKPIAEMELHGVMFDKQMAKQLLEEFVPIQLEAANNFTKCLEKYSDEINSYISNNPTSILTLPINPASPEQLAILFYDILKYPVVDKKKPRTTDQKAREKLNTDVTRAVDEYKKISTLINMFLNKLPEKVVESTGRIHCEFLPNRTVTGRFASKNPNLQQIPSRGKGAILRKIFTVPKGHCFVSMDYRSQEPRITAFLSQDEQLLNYYNNGDDLYVFIASKIFHLPEEECCEFNPDGTKNPEGKKRRSIAKAILLGITYGKQIPSIAADLNITVDEARDLFDTFFSMFPGVRRWMDDTISFARRYGYVETAYGRKRRVTDIKLPLYQFENLIDETKKAPDNLMSEWTKKFNRCKSWQQKLDLMNECELQTGYHVTDNKMKILKAEREGINARVQGTAADIGKLAIKAIANDERLTELGVHLLIPIHDELCFEIPIENVKEAVKLIEYHMVSVCADVISVPMGVDIEITDCWNGNKINLEELV